MLPLTLGLTSAAAARTGGDCPTPPPAIKEPIRTKGYYTDAQGSVADPKKLQSVAEAIRPLTVYVRTVVGLSDKYVASGNDPVLRACALSLLRAWAKDGALIHGTFSSHGEVTRTSALSSLALAYIKLGASSDRDPVIDEWLTLLSNHAMAWYAHRSDAFQGRHSNLDNWIALAVAATGYATGDRSKWDFAEGVFRKAAKEIEPDGTIKRELGRGKAATFYHGFAAGPLVVISSIGAVCDTPLGEENKEALGRLVELIRRASEAPDTLETAAGTKQDPVGRPAWFAILDAGVKSGTNIRMGGNLSNLQIALNSGPCPWRR